MAAEIGLLMQYLLQDKVLVLHVSKQAIVAIKSCLDSGHLLMTPPAAHKDRHRERGRKKGSLFCSSSQSSAINTPHEQDGCRPEGSCSI